MKRSLLCLVVFPALFSCLAPAASLSEVLFLAAADTTPAPAITGITPASIGAGGPAFILAVGGANFVNGSIVRWNNLPRATSFISSVQLTTTILASDITAAGTAQVTVVQPGGAVSNAVPFTITNETTLYFAQIAEGKSGSLTNKTILTLVNPNDVPVTAAVTFFSSPSGEPFPVDIGVGVLSAFEVTIPAKSEAVINSAGTRPTASAGWARVKAREHIGGLAVFQVFNSAGAFVTEAGVASSPLARNFVVPAEFKDEFESGLALVNPAELSIASVTLSLRNLNGTLLATVNRQLGPRQHTALFLRELFPGTVPAGFQGTIEINSTDPLAATTLRTLRGLQTSTLPVVTIPGQ